MWLIGDDVGGFIVCFLLVVCCCDVEMLIVLM